MATSTIRYRISTSLKLKRWQLSGMKHWPICNCHEFHNLTISLETRWWLNNRDYYGWVPLWIFYHDGDYIDIDSIAELYEIEDVPGRWWRAWRMVPSDNDRIMDELSELHSKIEDYLRNIDKQHGTQYCPSGALRIFLIKSWKQYIQPEDARVQQFIALKPNHSTYLRIFSFPTVVATRCVSNFGPSFNKQTK